MTVATKPHTLTVSRTALAAALATVAPAVASKAPQPILEHVLLEADGLTRSERFTSFRARDYWVTLAAKPFDSAEAANAWCVAEGLAPDDCFAKRLSHTEGPSGNTRPR